MLLLKNVCRYEPSSGPIREPRKIGEGKQERKKETGCVVVCYAWSPNAFNALCASSGIVTIGPPL